jgi:hypothetical protein
MFGTTAMAAGNFFDVAPTAKVLASVVTNPKESDDLRFNALAALKRNKDAEGSAKVLRLLLKDPRFKQSAARVLGLK